MSRLQKNISMILALFVVFAIVGMAQPGKASAAKKPVTSQIGVVDYGQLLDQHPDTQKANKALQAENEQAKQAYESKADSLNDKEKQEYGLQLQNRVEQKQQDLLKGITDKVNAAIREVADAKGITVVMTNQVVIYGGLDITNEVLAKTLGK